MKGKVLLAGGAVTAYLLYSNWETLVAVATGQEIPACPPGFVVSPDGTECYDLSAPCGQGFYLEAGVCKEYPPEHPQWRDPTKTGNPVADLFIGLGESLVAGFIFDRAASVANRNLQEAARKAALKAAQEKAEKTAAAVAEREAIAAAKRKAEQEAIKNAEQLARKKAQEAATREFAGRFASRTAAVAERAVGNRAAMAVFKRLLGKAAATATRMAALTSTGIGALLTPLSAISLGLTVGLIAAGPHAQFVKDREQDWDWEALPDAAQNVIGAVPFWGDLLNIVTPFIAFKTGCPDGTVEQNGLCYDPPKPGFECEAFLCYAHDYPGFSPLSETFAHMTKRILMDTGTIPNVCQPGMEHGEGGAFCYQKPDWADKIVLGTAWEGCKPGMTDTGIRCEDVYGGGVGKLRDCPGGWINDGLTCREPIRGGGCTGGGCHRECHGDPWKPVWEAGHQECRDWCDPIRCEPMSGGNVKGRGAGSDLPCPAGFSGGHDGLCYEDCRAGYRREGLLCTRSYTKRSEVLAPHENVCPDGKRDGAAFGSPGLCYTDDAHMPAGYSRVTTGLLDQSCPSDKPEWLSYPMFNPTQDIGVSCQRATYTRTPYPKFSIYGKHLYTPPPPPPLPELPPNCSRLTPLKDGEPPWRLCRTEDPPVGYELAEDGLTFYKKCRESYVYASDTKTCDKTNSDGTDDSYDNSAEQIGVIYEKH